MTWESWVVAGWMALCVFMLIALDGKDQGPPDPPGAPA